jgi:lipoyl(octanoyl) transferase
LDVRDLGRVPYAEAWELQRALVEQRHAGEIGDVLLMCEHDPVITTGRGTAEGFLLDERFEVFEVERGGEATYHGPGQIVAYPIVKLADDAHDLHGWMRALEEAVMETLLAFDLTSRRRPGDTGVWTADGARKLCSLGVAARRWVTYHGLALNHAPDLAHFGAIRPCGFEAGVMTSMQRELGEQCPPAPDVVDELAARLQAALAPFRV